MALNITEVYHYAECHYADCLYAECHCAECHYADYLYAECHGAECHYAESHYAECRVQFIVLLNIVLLSVVLLYLVAPSICVLGLWSNMLLNSFENPLGLCRRRKVHVCHLYQWVLCSLQLQRPRERSLQQHLREDLWQPILR
jgi:hypothetical protein